MRIQWIRATVQVDRAVNKLNSVRIELATDEETRMNVAGIEVFEYFINELGNEDVSHHDDLCDFTRRLGRPKNSPAIGSRDGLSVECGQRVKSRIDPQVTV